MLIRDGTAESARNDNYSYIVSSVTGGKSDEGKRGGKKEREGGGERERRERGGEAERGGEGERVTETD